MTTIKTKDGKIIKVVYPGEEDSLLTESDREMDKRAREVLKLRYIRQKSAKSR